MKFYKFLFLLLISFSCLYPQNKAKIIRKIDSFLILEDNSSALIEARKAMKMFPMSNDIRQTYIKTLSANNMELEALDAYFQLIVDFKEEKKNREILEKVCFSVLNKSIQSSQYYTRLAGLVGSYLTKDSRAVKNILKMMEDSNAIIRSVAVSLATNYQDDLLKDKIKEMFFNEKIWLVRLEILKAVGKMRIKDLLKNTKNLISSDKISYEEKNYAITSIVEMSDDVNEVELFSLIKSKRANFRILACELATRFETIALKDEIVKLTYDARFDVRIAAINSIFLFFQKYLKKEKILEIVKERIKDPDPSVSISAMRLAFSKNFINIAEEAARKWAFDSFFENRCLAAAAIATSGKRAVKIMSELIKQTKDSFVKVNLAIGLIGQREEILESGNIIYDFLKNEKKMIMYDSSKNTHIQTLMPSRLRHVDQIPNYPSAVDQLTKIDLLSILAIVEDSRAISAIKDFLKKGNFNLTGVAAATLIGEGDNECISIIKTLLNDEDPNIRFQAAMVLAIVAKDKKAVSLLQDAYFQASSDLKLHILEAVGYIGSYKSKDFLLTTIQDPFQIFRIISASSLIQCLNK